MSVENYPWAHGDHRYQVRPFVASKQTGLSDKDYRCLPPDLMAMEHAVIDWSEGLEEDCDPFMTHVVIPAWKEDEAQHTPGEVTRINLSAIGVSDAGIYHGYDGGTSMLGWLLNEQVTGSRRVPVLVTAHSGQEVSKGILGLPEFYPNLTIARFEDSASLYTLISDWLQQHAAAICEGPVLRRDIDLGWEPIRDLMRRTWEASSLDLRLRATESVSMSQASIGWSLHQPGVLTDLPVGVVTTLMALLGLAPSSAASSAPRGLCESLAPEELIAWQAWSTHTTHRIAFLTLDAALADRRTTGVNRDGFYLGLPEAWEEFSRRIRSHRADS